MNKIISAFVVVVIMFAIGGCANSSKLDEVTYSEPVIEQQTVHVEHTMSFDEIMESEIKSYLFSHNSITKNYESVKVDHDSSGFWFYISLQSCETYTFAAIVRAATDVVSQIVEKYEIETYHLNIRSPDNVSKSISWNSWSLDNGLLNDNTSADKYNEYCSLDYVLQRYGYEDFEGELSESISTNITQISTSPTVYIASSGNGKKYHRRKTCSGMNGNAVSISMEDAKAQGYSACKICY